MLSVNRVAVVMLTVYHVLNRLSIILRKIDDTSFRLDEGIATCALEER
jgi:hypothetical protein